MSLHEALGGCRILDEMVCRADWSTQKLAPTIGADATKSLFRAILAERAFERTRACLQAVRLQIDIATFAVWFEDQHVLHLSDSFVGSLAISVLAEMTI